MAATNVTPSDRPSSGLLDGTADRSIPPRSVGTDGDTLVFAGFLKFSDEGNTCWLRRTVRVDPTTARGDRLTLSVVEEYRDAGVGRTVPLARYSDTCRWDGDASVEGVQSAVTDWHVGRSAVAIRRVSSESGE